MTSGRTLSLRLGALLSALTLFAGCTPGSGGERRRSAPDEASPSVPQSEEPMEVVLSEVATLEQPVAMASRAGDDRLYVAERVGRIQVLRDGQPQPDAFLDISDETTTDSERGLLGLAFSPDGDRLYLSSTDLEGDSRLDEWTLEGDTATSRRPVMAVEQPYSNHNGGNIVFGPDGYLYYGLGDGGSGGDPEGNGQNTSTLLGALLRIDPEPDGSEPYGIPEDNPFVDDPEARPEIWAYGLRNPWRFSFDAKTGDLWIADVGQNRVEEVNFMPAGEGAGANYGWNLFEGTRPLAADAGDPQVGEAPVYEYPNNGGCSVTGGVVYRGNAFPELQGDYLFSDFCDGQIRALTQSSGAAQRVSDLGVGAEAVVGFGEDQAGEVFVLSLSGPVLRLDPA